jgi:Zn-dependent protease with chaperone function
MVLNILTGTCHCDLCLSQVIPFSTHTPNILFHFKVDRNVTLSSMHRYSQVFSFLILYALYFSQLLAASVSRSLMILLLLLLLIIWWWWWWWYLLLLYSLVSAVSLVMQSLWQGATQDDIFFSRFSVTLCEILSVLYSPEAEPNVVF